MLVPLRKLRPSAWKFTHPGSGRMNFQADGRSLRSGTSIKFTFTISEDGTTVDGVRETDRGLVSRITMTRCTFAAMAPATAQAPTSQPTDAPPCTLNEKFVPVSGQTGKSFAELLTAPATSGAQAKFLGAWQGSMAGETVRLVVFSTNRL